MFEVGKKYKSGLHKGPEIFECIYSDDHGGLLRYISNTFFVRKPHYGDYREYKEPRSIDPIWMNVLVNMSKPEKIWLSGTSFFSKERAQEYARLHMSGCTLIDTIKITYTEKV